MTAIENQELSSKSIEVSISVIIHAGNARTLVKKALDEADKNNIDEARRILAEASEEIKSAHISQTEIIQAEARGENIEVTLLLTHAQDTLMVAKSEVEYTKNIFNLYEKVIKLEKS